MRLDPELKARLARRAEAEGVPVSEVIRDALRHHLEAS
ncbi:MAG: ribbon-helix-helix domain-containing protein [Actinomycetota bacterium]|nr:ribbon-helix-helix domain-containing protein [Actinomycetota bacterium]